MSTKGANHYNFGHFLQKSLNYLPLRDNYKEVHSDAIVLRATPNISRLCFLLEFAIGAFVFAYSYYYTAATSTTNTVVTYEVLSGSYSCSLLSPLSTTVEYSTTSSELAQFSSARYTYDECYDALGSSGYDVCSDDNRKDYLISVAGLTANDDNCMDLILAEGYRFCFGSVSNTPVADSDIQKAFIRQEGQASYSDYTNKYYFMNSSDIIVVNDAPFTDTSGVFLSDYITDGGTSVFVVAENPTDSKYYCYHFSPSLSTATVIASISGSTVFYGLTYGGGAIHYYTLAGGQGHIASVVLSTGVQTVVDVACTTTSTTIDVAGSSSRFITYGDDGKVWAMCTQQASTSTQQQQQTSTNYIFYQVDTSASTYTEWSIPIRNYNITTSDSTAKSQSVAYVYQIFQKRDNLYFNVGADSKNILQVKKNNISNVVNLGEFSGSYFINTYSNILYLPDSNYNYLNTTSNTLNEYSSTFRSDYYYAFDVQLAFTYQICNGNLSDYLIDASSDTSFYSMCDDINGIYYQVNQYYSVPSTCVNAITNTSQMSDILDCSDMKTLQEDFVSDFCEYSRSEVCTSEYTDNPPFSCTKDVYSSFLTCIATAFANASGVWTFVVIFLKLVLRRFYPHGSNDFIFDHDREKYLPLDEHHISHNFSKSSKNRPTPIPTREIQLHDRTANV